MDNNQPFRYTYSAQQQEEIRRIRSKYIAPEEDKMDQLRKLHFSATRKAKACSIAIGTLGALILGTGMSLILTDLGTILNLTNSFGVGLITGLAGLIFVALAYPVYSKVLKEERTRIAPEILRLTDELLK